MAASTWMMGALLAFGAVDVIALDAVVGPRALGARDVPAVVVAAAAPPARGAAPPVRAAAPPARGAAPPAPAPAPPEPPAPAPPPAKQIVAVAAPHDETSAPPAKPPAEVPAPRAAVVIRFATDRATLDAAATHTLDELAVALAATPRESVEIVGHADARGAESHNLALSARRMRRVRDYLAARGVAAGRMRGRAAGDREPAQPGDGDAALAANRRAEIRRMP